MTGDVVTIEEAAAMVDRWIDPARVFFDRDETVHLTFSPGDGTCYVMSFVPPGMYLCTPGEAPRMDSATAALVVLHTGQTRGGALTAVANRYGSPDPTYITEKLSVTNPYTMLAAGLLWRLMVDPNPVTAADAFRPISEAHPNVLAKWDRDMIELR